LKSFCGFSGVPSKTVPGGSFKFRRGGLGSDFFVLASLVFMVVLPLSANHQPFVKTNSFPAPFVRLQILTAGRVDKSGRPPETPIINAY